MIFIKRYAKQIGDFIQYNQPIATICNTIRSMVHDITNYRQQSTPALNTTSILGPSDVVPWDSLTTQVFLYRHKRMNRIQTKHYLLHHKVKIILKVC